MSWLGHLWRRSPGDPEITDQDRFMFVGLKVLCQPQLAGPLTVESDHTTRLSLLGTGLPDCRDHSERTGKMGRQYALPKRPDVVQSGSGYFFYWSRLGKEFFQVELAPEALRSGLIIDPSH